MKICDLVMCKGSFDRIARAGIVIDVLGRGPFGMQVYKVMRSNGTIATYTAAAVRRLK